jgi:aspartyl-tRNA(Asn)/glutamyl-tRNA(Gln) amidotransferase subunit A
MPLSYLTIAQIQSDLKAGTITCESLVLDYLSQIEQNQKLNAFLEVYAEEALEKAKAQDTEIAEGRFKKLTGIVVGLKDNICYKGHKVSASSKILEGFESLFSATVTERLLDEGAIIIGRLNCDEFAMGASNENSAFGPVLNAADNERVSGGSSGGAAVAVQAGMCHFSLGSDTGGSIRQPASFCGLWGYKPSYGMVSRHGLLSYASSFDQIGPITKSAEDMALVMDIISGADQHDATLLQEPKPDFINTKTAKEKPAFAVVRDCLEHEGIDPEIRNFTLDFIEQLKTKGHEVEMVDFPFLDVMVPCYFVLTTAEASSNLSRYCGLLFGHRSGKAVDLDSTFTLSRTEGFGEEVKRRIMLGTFVLSSNHYGEYYTKAQKVRELIRQKTNELFNKYNYILMPTTSTPAFKLGEKASNPIAMYLADLYTVHANLAGIPAITIPSGMHSSGLPFGLQLMAPYGQDAALIKLSERLFNFSLSEA